MFVFTYYSEKDSRVMFLWNYWAGTFSIYMCINYYLYIYLVNVTQHWFGKSCHAITQHFNSY